MKVKIRVADPYVEYDIDEMNEFWDSTIPWSRIISHDEIYLLRYWDLAVR